MNDEITVELDAIPLSWAHTLMFALRVAMESGSVTGDADYRRMTAMRVMVEYRCLVAEA